tara:strand:+ start:1039 stop:1293 length:255 start_codon:yes stop_codon:yes gene_type:complete
MSTNRPTLSITPIIETKHIIISPFPGITGTYTVRCNDKHVGWVMQVAPASQVNAWEAVNMDGDTKCYFGSQTDAASYLVNGETK